MLPPSIQLRPPGLTEDPLAHAYGSLTFTHNVTAVTTTAALAGTLSG